MVPLKSAVFSSLLVIVIASSAEARIRIFGGPVESAGSGIYYPPGGSASLSTQPHRNTPKVNPAESEIPLIDGERIDLNPGFVPGETFRTPTYVPPFFPRTIYFPDYTQQGQRGSPA
ncbi:hypothetical protein SH668x_001369 [Planctomicrobium sp. SH668]|uniref:hypothetical protein n=1 Tax=Planctomicrobium sp. SH668 TaxID=3448126 RepID=UPI003F5BB494